MQTDEQLLAAFVAGDQTAFTELVERYQEPLTNYVAAPRLDPDDIVQAVFIAVADDAYRFIPGKSVKPWLYLMASRFIKRERAGQPQC